MRNTDDIVFKIKVTLQPHWAFRTQLWGRRRQTIQRMLHVIFLALMVFKITYANP